MTLVPRIAFRFVANDVPRALENATVSTMGKARRVLVCGDSVALAGIAASLSLAPDCEVLGCIARRSAGKYWTPSPRRPDLRAGCRPAGFVYAVSRHCPACC